MSTPRVTFADGASFDGKVLESDAELDLALVQIAPQHRPAPVFGDVARPNLAVLAEASQDLADRKARELGFAVEAMEKNTADRSRYKREAWKGLNERMLASGAELVLVFHPDFDASKGSKHMAELATQANVEVRIVAA